MASKRPSTTEEITAGKRVLRARVAEGTRSQYNTMMSHLRKWLEKEYPRTLAAGMVQLPLPVDVCTNYLAYVSVKRGSGTQSRPNSYSTVNGYINAIKFMYKEASEPMSTEMVTMLKDFANGYKREVARFREQGDLPMQEGKGPMTIEGYRFLAHAAATVMVSQSSKFEVHCFLALSWNLIARAASVASIRYDHISWEGDAILIQFGRTKSDQEGTKCFPRHIYANPLDPAICPILSLAVLVFTKGSRRDGLSTLVFGPNAKEGFSSWLQRTCTLHKDHLCALGLRLADVGTHSFRKGASTALSNTPGGPQGVSIWLRAEWSLGSVQNRYIFAGSGGDQHVGRAAAGLDMNGVDFAILPPHFDGCSWTTQEWETVLPGYGSFYPQSFRSAIPFLLASLVHHRPWLKANLHPSHPLFASAVWNSGWSDKYGANVQLGRLRNEITGMVASGIPPHVVLASRISGVESALSTMHDVVASAVQSLPGKVSANVVAKLSASNSVAINWTAIEEHFVKLSEKLVGTLSTLIPQRWRRHRETYTKTQRVPG